MEKQLSVPTNCERCRADNARRTKRYPISQYKFVHSCPRAIRRRHAGVRSPLIDDVIITDRHAVINAWLPRHRAARRVRSVNNEARYGSMRDLDPRCGSIGAPGAFSSRGSPFSPASREKNNRSREGFPRAGKEGPSRTWKSTAENYGRRRNSRGVVAVKNCIFSCQKIGGGRRGEGEGGEDEGSACTGYVAGLLPRSFLLLTRTARYGVD